MNKFASLINGARIKKRYHSNQRDPKVWVFGEWFGQRCCDNSMYLANYIAEKYPKIQVYWASRKDADLSGLRQEIGKISFGDEEAILVYKKAGVVFMNQGYQDFSDEGVNYFSGAVCVNLWHGVMWKHIGHDGSKQSGLIYRLYTKANDSVFGANAYVATSEDYAKVCETAFGAMPEQVIRAGYPRNSIFYQAQELLACRKLVLDTLVSETGINWPDDTRIITYMPTFRDKAENSFSFEELAGDKRLMNWLEDNNTVILQKAHLITQQRHEMESIKAQKRIFAFNNVAAQILLAATDLLITDYSSCFFDYLILDRPIIHFIYDYDYYVNQDRGVYYKKEEICCGDIAMSKEELPELIIQNMENPQKEQLLRAQRREEFMTYDTPDTCKLIFKAVQERLQKS